MFCHKYQLNLYLKCRLQSLTWIAIFAEYVELKVKGIIFLRSKINVVAWLALGFLFKATQSLCKLGVSPLSRVLTVSTLPGVCKPRDTTKMDLLYGSEQKFNDLDEDMNDFLDNDVFQSPTTTVCYFRFGSHGWQITYGFDFWADFTGFLCETERGNALTAPT